MRSNFKGWSSDSGQLPTIQENSPSPKKKNRISLKKPDTKAEELALLLQQKLATQETEFMKMFDYMQREIKALKAQQMIKEKQAQETQHKNEQAIKELKQENKRRVEEQKRVAADLREELNRTRKDQEDEIKQLRLDLNRVTGGRKDSTVQNRSRSVLTIRDDSGPSVLSAKKIYSVDPITIERTPKKTGNAMNKPISVGSFNPPKRP